MNIPWQDTYGRYFLGLSQFRPKFSKKNLYGAGPNAAKRRFQMSEIPCSGYVINFSLMNLVHAAQYKSFWIYLMYHFNNKLWDVYIIIEEDDNTER